MAIQEKIRDDQQEGYRQFLRAVISLRDALESVREMEDELGIDIQIIDLVPACEGIASPTEFLDLIEKLKYH